jgi:hypothetical protein
MVDYMLVVMGLIETNDRSQLNHSHFSVLHCPKVVLVRRSVEAFHQEIVPHHSSSVS